MKLKGKQLIDNFIGGLMVACHVPLVVLLGKTLRINHQLNKAPNYIIIIKILGFGSLLLSSDAILALKRKYPNTKFILIGGNSIKEGADILKLFDSIKIIDDSSFFKMLTSSFKIIFWCLSHKNKWSFDFEVYSRLTTIFSLYTFSKNRFGFEFEKVNFRNYLNTHNIYFNHFVPTEANYNLMAQKAIATVSERYFFPIKVDSKLSTIVINNTCSDLSLQRKLKPSQVSEIISKLADFGFEKFALSGSPSDYFDNENIISFLKNNKKVIIENWAGKYSFKDYILKLKSEAKCLITIDSAPLHIAARLNIPILSIWGPTQPQSIAPDWLRKGKIYQEINLKVKCSPCVHHTKELPCGGNNFCINDIDINQVIEKFKLLNIEK